MSLDISLIQYSKKKVNKMYQNSPLLVKIVVEFFSCNGPL